MVDSLHAVSATGVIARARGHKRRSRHRQPDETTHEGLLPSTDRQEERATLVELEQHYLKKSMPPEIHRLGSTIRKWFDKLCNYHVARVSNGPTEALDNLMKPIKRIGFGFRNFGNYRQSLLSAASPTGECSDRSSSNEGVPSESDEPSLLVAFSSRA